jgi:hypothetical protein
MWRVLAKWADEESLAYLQRRSPERQLRDSSTRFAGSE